MAYSGYNFIGPLKPGQRPPPPPSQAELNHNWTVLDLLKDPQLTSGADGKHLALASSSKAGQIGKSKRPKKFLRAAGGTTWEDPTLAEWDPEDYRIFVGDLGNDVTDELLKNTFGQYPSFVKAKVVRDKRTDKSKGYGFVSFKDVQDYAKAMKEWDGKYLGNRPIKLRKSLWKDRLVEERRKKGDEVALPAEQ